MKKTKIDKKMKAKGRYNYKKTKRKKIMQNFCKKHVRMRKIWYNNSNQLEMR